MSELQQRCSEVIMSPVPVNMQHVENVVLFVTRRATFYNKYQTLNPTYGVMTRVYTICKMKLSKILMCCQHHRIYFGCRRSVLDKCVQVP